MTDRKWIELRLSEYRTRHTGKDPFGPVTDLRDLFASLDVAGQSELRSLLLDLGDDPFWSPFIMLSGLLSGVPTR